MPLDANDLLIIQSAIAEGGKVWDNELLSDVKAKIKTHYLTITEDQCCYCRKDFTNEFKMVIDIEHVLPKAKYGDFMFELFNLSVSCKRCNMKIKGERLDFLIDSTTIHLNPRDPNQYLFIHPNLDNYFDNIEFLALFRNNKRVIKYVCQTGKGHFTYAFFELNKIEVNTINEAQGINISETEFSPEIPADIVAETNVFLNQL
ncbi:HNH endonuclease [Pedobacter sp. P351]|uniref:HNH endonuclease n=1 Tax=Pedobacter superstes TaxID=3133441 RepID=UPI0030B231AE